MADKPKDSPPGAALRTFATFVGLVGTCLPGSTFFTKHAPPFFTPIALVTSGFAAVVFLWGYVRAPADKNRIPGRAVIAMLLAILLLVAYGILLNFVTVLPRGGRVADRQQIGLYLAPWSLTERASDFIEDMQQQSPPPVEVKTPNDLMEAFGVWGGRNPVHAVWKLHTIIEAGCLLIGLFLVAFVLWSYACGITAKYFAR